MKISSPRPPPLASTTRPETSSSSISLFSNSSILTFSNADQEALKKHIIEVCESKRNLSILKWERLKNQFMVDKDHKIAYCRHGKVINAFFKKSMTQKKKKTAKFEQKFFF